MPNAMLTLMNIGGALLFNAAKFGCTHTTRVPCSNAAKTRKLLKLAGGAPN